MLDQRVGDKLPSKVCKSACEFTALHAASTAKHQDVFFLNFRRATCFGGDEDDYDQEAGGRAESDRKYKKVGSSCVLRRCVSSGHEAHL